MLNCPGAAIANSKKHLMDSLDDLKNDLNSLTTVLLLDYDGTLTPIVRTPDEAVLHSDMKNTLLALKEKPNIIIAIISGRSLEDVKSKVKIDGICYAGNHGMEIEHKDKFYINPEAKDKNHIVQEIYIELELSLGGIEGIIIENKGLTISVHYRIVDPKDGPKIEEIVERIIKKHVDHGDIKLTHGKKVLEIQPNIQWDKAKVVQWVLNSAENRSVDNNFAIFICDDRADEDSFKTLNVNGHTVLVSSEPKETNAKYVLTNVAEVKKFLGWVSSLNENN